MNFSLSTSYFAGHHLSPEAIAEKTLSLGFTGVELGYFTRETEIDAWCHIIEQMPLDIKSLHAFCPMPVGMPQLGPEVFSLADPDETARQQAIAAILRALDAAQAVNAEAIVCHGGRVDLRQNGLLFGSKPYRSQLSQAFRMRGGQPDFTLVQKERDMRAEAAPRWVDNLSRSLDHVLPHFEAAQMVLAFENLPGIEAFPDPAELAFLKQRFPTPALGAWYDIGHGERKQRVGDWPVEDTLAFTAPFTAGVHIHDVMGLEEDHTSPGEGGIDFEHLRPLLEQEPLIRVFEPNPNLSEARLQAGLAFMQAFFTP
jgi:sugar phosphate isomerase/epimerase